MVALDRGARIYFGAQGPNLKIGVNEKLSSHPHQIAVFFSARCSVPQVSSLRNRIAMIKRFAHPSNLWLDEDWGDSVKKLANKLSEDKAKAIKKGASS